MANNKEPKSVPEILARIDELKEEIKIKSDEITRLQSRLRVQDEKPEPSNFDYKEAILGVFSKKPSEDLKIDSVEAQITQQYSFTPGRNKIANKIAYLVDRDKVLERVDGKRGFYRLSKKTETPSPTEQGVV